jgi:hypothetical protein
MTQVFGNNKETESAAFNPVYSNGRGLLFIYDFIPRV